MDQIKVFATAFDYGDKPKTDEKINKWLEKNPGLEIVEMLSNLSDDDGDLSHIVTIRYKESTKLRLS